MRQSAAPVEPVTTKVQGSRRLRVILGAIIVVAVVALATTASKVIDHPSIVVAMHNRSENPMTTVRGLYHELERCVHCALEDHRPYPGFVDLQNDRRPCRSRARDQKGTAIRIPVPVKNRPFIQCDRPLFFDGFILNGKKWML